MRDVWRPAGVCGTLLIATIAVAHVAGGADEPKPGIPWSEQRSGASFLSQATRDQQNDLTVNPGMLWVEKGGELWATPAGTANKSCADCHGEPKSLAGVAARYPAWDERNRRLHDIATRIENCRAEHQGAKPLSPDDDDLLALTTLVTHQSRGLPMAPVIDGPARASFEAGRALYYQRFGQLNLSCAQCHEQNWGHRLRTETVSQGQSNGYPLYRLEWQTLGSLHRRLRSCFNSVRAVPPAHGSPEHLSLELFLAWRAKGLPVEAPAVRR